MEANEFCFTTMDSFFGGKKNVQTDAEKLASRGINNQIRIIHQ